MSLSEKLYMKILGCDSGAVSKPGEITRDEALSLYNEELPELCRYADKLRRYFCGNSFDICTIVNAKNGACPENCRFCAQSAYNKLPVKAYPLRSADELVAEAKKNHDQGVLRYSIVTSGKRLNDVEVDKICEAIARIRSEVGISVCLSAGLLDKEQFLRLKAAGLERIHNNLETSERNFPNICTSHSFGDKLDTILAAKEVGLEVCSGGIIGLNESREDRIDMAFSLKSLDITSVPINILNPIPGTYFEHAEPLSYDEILRTIAIYRFILPNKAIRLAGGRGLLPDKGEACFISGANAAISGDMLTTQGITTETDMKLLAKLGYKAEKSINVPMSNYINIQNAEVNKHE